MALEANDFRGVESGVSIDEKVDLGERTLCAIQCPVGTVAADLSILVSSDGHQETPTWFTLPVGVGTFSVVAGLAQPVDPALFYAWRWVKLASSEDQGATQFGIVAAKISR